MNKKKKNWWFIKLITRTAWSLDFSIKRGFQKNTIMDSSEQVRNLSNDVKHSIFNEMCILSENRKEKRKTSTGNEL
jgi:hypothetical protein